MKDFLDKKILLYKERDYAPRDLIAFFANKAGGSHYSTKLPQDFKELLSFRLFGQEALSNALLQIGELTLNLTLNLLKQIADIEMHLSLFLPKQKITEKGFIFDFDYPNSNMRIFAYLNSLKELRFGVVGINGYEVIIICEQTIDWSKPHHLNFKLFIEDNVTSTLEIFVDGQKVASKNIPQPLILANDPFHYNVYYNRSSQSVNHSMSVGVNQIVMYGSHHNKSEHAQMVSHFKESLSEDQIDLIYFKKGSYGIQASGDKNIKMHGSVLKSNMRKLIKSQSQE